MKESKVVEIEQLKIIYDKLYKICNPVVTFNLDIEKMKDQVIVQNREIAKDLISSIEHICPDIED